MGMCDGYRPIKDYALIGDGPIAALIARDGSLDWACFPRFDPPSVFARILDADRGSNWAISPREPARASRRYLPDTNVLDTTFETASGIASLLDFLPPRFDAHGRLVDRTIVRLVRVGAAGSRSGWSWRRASTTACRPRAGRCSRGWARRRRRAGPR